MKVWLRTRFCEKSQKYKFFNFSIDCPIVVGMVIYGRKSAIWSPGRLRKRQNTKKLYLGHILRKSKKNRHFYPKSALKKFSKSIFTGRSCLDNKSISLEDTSYRAPKHLYCGLYHQLLTTFPHMLNFRGEKSNVHFFRFFPLKWST